MMNPIEIGTRGFLFEFNGSNSPFEMPTYTYVIIGRKKVYICDTHVGPKSMEIIKEYIDENFPGKEMIAFNSHLHWDHVWGNSSFKDSTIIAHQYCFENLSNDAIWNSMIESSSQYSNGEIIRTIPNKTFIEKMEFPEDEIIFYYTPGHTIDSASCFDLKDKVLFVGDNIEAPIPCLDWHHLDRYIETLYTYLELGADTIIASHNGIVTSENIQANIKYLKQVSNNSHIIFDQCAEAETHKYNLIGITFSRFLEIAEDKKSPKFDMNKFMEIVFLNPEATLKEIEQGLTEYIETL